jgi:hypothetical protein
MAEQAFKIELRVRAMLATLRNVGWRWASNSISL